MSENKNNGFRTGLAAGVVATLLTGAAVFEYWIYGADQVASLTPQTGGMELSETSNMSPSADQPAAEPTSTPNSIDVGDFATSFDKIRIYDEPDTVALVLNEYSSISRFVVVEPGSQFAFYPVTNLGENWIRVRADDGLVGWAMIDHLKF